MQNFQYNTNEMIVGKGMKNAMSFLISFVVYYLPFMFDSLLLQPAIEMHLLKKLRSYRHNDYAMIITSSIMGILTGGFVVLFHKTMEFTEVFFKRVSGASTNLFSTEILILPIITALGGLLIGILQRTIFNGATMTGLHTVVNALVYNDGRIDWRNSFKSIIFAAISISSGGAAGREGPTIALGATVGSAMGQTLRLKTNKIRILAGSGAAAAISAIFNAPLGGIVFASEAILGDISIRSFVPLVIASVLSTATTRIFVGDRALIIAPALQSISLADYFLLALSGILSGFVAIYFLKSYKFTERLFKVMVRRVPEILKPAIGGLLAGSVLVFLPTMWETTYSPINSVIAGNGAPLLQGSLIENGLRILTRHYAAYVVIFMAAATILLKPITNAFTIASGGAGGTFAPAIKTGAMFGFCFGVILNMIFPGSPIGLYAVVCAAAVLAGTYQAPLSAGIILFEICRNYDLILPLIFSTVFASFIVQKSKIITFNPLQSDIVDDESRLHPVLKVFAKKDEPKKLKKTKI